MFPKDTHHRPGEARSHIMQAALDTLPTYLVGDATTNPLLVEKTEYLYDAFRLYAESIRQIPLLQTIASGQADTRTWIRYLVPRLHDANAPVQAEGDTTLFERTLQAISNAACTHGLEPAAVALQENFNEERGIVDGKYVEQEAHRTWRREFRDTMFAALKRRGATENDLQPHPKTEASKAYEAYMRSLIGRAHQEKPWFQLGAITALELYLREEFQCVCEGLQHSFPEIENKDARYVHHHAGHEERHFAELFSSIVVSITAQELRERIKAVTSVVNGAMVMHWYKTDVLESYT